MAKKLKNFKRKKYNIFLILARYVILLGLVFSLPLIYKIFAPLTIYPVSFLLKIIFKNISVVGDIITINNCNEVQIISSCIAGSAYLLLLILNLTVPMNWKKRIFSISLSFIILLILNILRIFLFSILHEINFVFFDITHMLFWYVLSIVFVVGIWFLITKIFSITQIPVYSDIKLLIKNIKSKRNK